MIQSLERNAQQVVRRDWTNTIGEELRQGEWCRHMGHGGAERWLLESVSLVRHSLSVGLFVASVDLRKFRTYQGGSVRDLLRAMRNKVCVGGREGSAVH